MFNSSNSNRVEAFTVLQAITSLVFVWTSEWMRFQGTVYTLDRSRQVNPSTVSYFYFIFLLWKSLCQSVYGVPINQGNYLAVRFSVLVFISESERQPIGGCKIIWEKKIGRGQKCVEISSSLVAILHLRGQEVLWLIIRATLCIILVFGQQREGSTLSDIWARATFTVHIPDACLSTGPKTWGMSPHRLCESTSLEIKSFWGYSAPSYLGDR